MTVSVTATAVWGHVRLDAGPMLHHGCNWRVRLWAGACVVCEVCARVVPHRVMGRTHGWAVMGRPLIHQR